MSSHGRSVFLNSCIKKPLNPRNRHPNPSYLVPQCSLDRGLDDPQVQDNMNAITRKKANSKCPLARTGHQRRTKCCSITHQLRKETDNFQSLVKFYDSIPDYNELNHLPNEEFYCKLNTLRKKHRELRFNCADDGFDPVCPKAMKMPTTESVEPTEKTVKSHLEDNESLHSWSKSPPAHCGGILNANRKGLVKSVRIEDTKRDGDDDSETKVARRKFRAGTPFASDPEDSTRNASTSTTPVNSDFVERYDRYVRQSLRSKSASPIRDYSKITIPQPYKMTQRDEEERTLQELLIASKNAFSSKESLDKPSARQIKANPVPITSRIPLFDSIMAEQDYRNRLAKLNSEIELQQQMKPFHFSERLNRPNSRCLSRSLSSPALLTTGFETRCKLTPPFKAKPCPKNLFSNYFYFKMWEDQYFRDMSKRIRAEELMKQASLPPSMARRDRALLKSSRQAGPRGEDSADSTGKSKRKRKSKRSAKRKKNVEERCSEFFSRVNGAVAYEDRAKVAVKPLYPSSNSSYGTSGDANQLACDATPIYPVNRPNLAATLRTEWCRKKLRNMELDETAGNAKKASKFEWGVKKSQAFQNLNLDTTHQEEVNLRLATRRAEQRLRQEEHAINMELMRQRVKAAPLLLEGPPQWGPRLGHVTHRCLTGAKNDPLLHKSSKTKKSLTNGRRRGSASCSQTVNDDRNESPGEKHRSSSGSKISNYSLESFDQSSSKLYDSVILGKLEDGM
ncbi:protein FAM161A [Topomyia yanbarensis]|uniref:protein FAM161A n=1 Tax=Topomyia yanbarensis TaxID=2498891 RepID=UPI00273CED0A|nr:protein FAM161A [Topomyia yanbarensis]